MPDEQRAGQYPERDADRVSARALDQGEIAAEAPGEGAAKRDQSMMRPERRMPSPVAP